VIFHFPLILLIKMHGESLELPGLLNNFAIGLVA
jgi:hypothetical protein